MHERWPVRRLALARLLSGAGSWAAGIAVSYYVFRRTGSAVWLAGTLFLVIGVSGFFSPLAGKIADRNDRRLVMIASDLGSAACWLALVWIHEPAPVVAVAFVASIVGLPYDFAATAAIPNLAGEEELGWANGLMSAAGSISRLVGPALGGALYALAGVAIAFAVNAASFLLSALLSASIRRVPFSSESPGDSSSSWEGFRVIRHNKLLLRLLIAWTISYFAMDIAFVADPPLATAFGVGAFGYGMMDTFFGAGALAGSLYGRRITVVTEQRWIVLGLLGVAGGWALIAGAPWFALVLIASAGAAAMDAIGTVAGFGLIQRRTEDRVRGRVFAAYHLAGMVANMVGFIIVGPLVDAFGPRAVYAVGGLMSLIAAAVFVPRSRSAEPGELERL